MVGPEWTADTLSPASIDGRNTQTLHMPIDSDLDCHCARASGVVLDEPATQVYGDHTSRTRDFEGLIWTFAQNVTPFSVEDAEQATGLQIEVFP